METNSILPGWHWLNQNAWIASALLVVALFGAAGTMAWHIYESRSARYNYLVIVGLMVLAASFVLTGISVGENPILTGRQLIPTIRLLWLTSALTFNFYLCAYWVRRLQWKKRQEGNSGSDSRTLHQTVGG